jgi:tetratricopeptide (TPR) repeat protein
VAYVKIGDTLLLLGQTAPAQGIYLKCLEIMQAIHHAEPDNAPARRDLSISYDKLGNVSMQLGELKASQEYFEKSLQLREHVARQDPDNAQAALDLVASFSQLGQVYRAAKQYPEAGAWLRKAMDQLRRLEAQGKLSPAKKEWLTIMEKELNALPQ